jgi:putative ABC transport system permease protein
MFLRIVADSFGRRPRHKLLTGAALALGMGVATAALSVSLDVGDRLAKEFRSLGANLLVTPQADSLPLEIGGVDYRPVNAGAYLPEADLPKLKTIFWHNNIIAFAPLLEMYASVASTPDAANSPNNVQIIGTWADYPIYLSDGSTFTTGIDKTNPWFHIDGRWFAPDAGTLKRVNVFPPDLPPGAAGGHTYVPIPDECVVGVHLAKRLPLHTGDHLYITYPNREDMQNYLGKPSIGCAITGILTAGAAEDDAVLMPLISVDRLARQGPGQYRKLYVSALTKPEDDFARRNPKTMKSDEFERWSCSPYVSSIAYSIKQVLAGTDVRVIRRVAEGEGQILTRVRMLLWLVTGAALLAAALAVGASSAASVIERRTEIGLMKALGAGSGTVGFLLAAEQLLLAFVGGGAGYALGIVLARLVGEKIFGAAPEPSVIVFFVVIALATGVTILGSALPLRRASRIAPAPILRGE